jgi:septum formation topological specificity factor MinE
VQTIAQCGALEYGLTLALNISGKHKETFLKFSKLIQCHIDLQNRMRLILAASMKDTNSSLHVLGPDLLNLVAKHIRVPEVVLWEDVLSNHIEHDILVTV